MLATRDRHLAKHLARIIVTNEIADPEQLKPALQRLVRGRPARESRLLLKVLHRAMAEELQRTTLTVESSQPLDAETLGQLVTAFSRNRPGPLRVRQMIMPELIAGLRVRLGDAVFESSVANRLQWMADHIREMLQYYPRKTDEHHS